MPAGRCIKPNDEKMPATFNGKLVVKQLRCYSVVELVMTVRLTNYNRYTGMVEAVRVRKEGYSYRPKFAEFLYSYKCLGYAFTSKVLVANHGIDMQLPIHAQIIFLLSDQTNCRCMCSHPYILWTE